MNFDCYVDIITERMVMRPFELTDAKNVFYNWASDYDTMRMLGCKPYASIYESQQKLNQKIINSQNGKSLRWCIDFGKYNCVGYVSFFVIDDDSCYITYCVAPNMRRKGIVTEAVGAAMDFLIRHCGYSMIIAESYSDNIPSRNLLKKIGFTEESAYDLSRNEIRLVMKKEDYICSVEYDVKYLRKEQKNEGNQ